MRLSLILIIRFEELFMLSLLMKCLAGALAVLLISLASQSRYFVLAGLVPLFPTFALIAHVMVGTAQPAHALQMTALFGLWAIVPYAAYLLTVYGLSVRLSLGATLISAALVWMIVAALTMMVWFRIYPAVR
jgi:membrane protein GlpM